MHIPILRLARARRPGSPRTPYTTLEVRHRLRQSPAACPRTAAVHAAAADVGAWTSLLDARTAFELGRAADRLPTVVFWFCRGRRLDEIGRQLTPFGSTWDGDQAVEAASHLIARLLNTSPAAYVPNSARHTRSA
jgi:hypothetical protein